MNGEGYKAFGVFCFSVICFGLGTVIVGEIVCGDDDGVGVFCVAWLIGTIIFGIAMVIAYG